jgi:penicillin V acylase-like amidase (Ntn superfamily)
MGSDIDMTDEGLYFSNTKRKPSIQYLEDDEMEVLSVQQQMKKMKLPSNEYDSAEDDIEAEYDRYMDLQDFKVVIKTLSGQSIDIKVSPMFTVQQLKGLIYNQISVDLS